MKVEIEDLKKVKLSVDEVIVVTYNDATISQEALDSTCIALREVFPKNKILVVPNNIDIDIAKEINPKLEWIKKQRDVTSRSITELNQDWDEREYFKYTGKL